jgi:tetratricopeptide (TPR) repeat protein
MKKYSSIFVNLIIFSFQVLTICNTLNAQTVAQRADSMKKRLLKMGEDTNKVNLLNVITYNYIDFDNAAARQYNNLAIELANKLKFDFGLGDAYIYSGMLNHIEGKDKESRASYGNALEIFKKLKHLRGQSIALGNTATTFLDRGNYDSALYYQMQSLSLDSILADKRSIGIDLGNIGLTYEYKADYNKSLEYYTKSIKIDESTNNTLGISDNFNSMGNIFYARGEYDKAIEYHLKSIELKKRFDDNKGIAYALNNIGNAYVQKGDLSNAQKYYLQSLKYLDLLGDKMGLIGCLGNIGAIYYFQKNYKRAEDYYIKSLTIAKSVNDKLGISSALINLGETNRDENNFITSIKYYTEGINTAKSINARDRLRDGYKGLSDAYIKMKDYKNAYLTFTKYTEVKDSILNSDNNQSMNNLEVKYETDKKEKENVLLKKDQIIYLARLHQERTQKLIWIISSLSVFIIVGLGIIFWRKRRNYRFNQEILEVKHEALNAQMSDHFISNSMDSINNFIENNEKGKASEYLLMFNRLIRKVLDNSFKKLIPLADELEVLKMYIELEKLRFPENALRYELEIDNRIDTNNTYVPPLIFQILAENAIKHGFRKNNGGTLKLSIWRKGQSIICSVEDNGSGRSKNNYTEEAKGRKSFGTSLAEKLIKTGNNLKEKANYMIFDLIDNNNNPIGTKVEFSMPVINAA